MKPFIVTLLSIVFLVISTSGATFERKLVKNDLKQNHTELAFDWNSNDGFGNDLIFTFATAICFLLFALSQLTLQEAQNQRLHVKCSRRLYILFHNIKTHSSLIQG